MPEASRPLLAGVKCWIVDALREEPHPTHFCLSETLEEIDRADVPMGVLTNMHITLDYVALTEKLPAHITVGYDGFRVSDCNGEISFES